ncbi:hypothetical protein FAIPA1_170100 [Frankia sp. AiPs1]
MLIDGRLVDAGGGRVLENINPATESRRADSRLEQLSAGHTACHLHHEGP